MKDKNKNIVISIVGVVIIAFIGLVVFHFISQITNNKKEKEEMELRFKEITFSVPSEFEYEPYYTIKDYSYSDNGVYCNFAIRSSDKEYYDSLEEWFKERINFNLNDKVSELKEVDINGKTFLNINKEYVNEKSYYYGVSSSNYNYFIEYTISDYMNGDREDINDNLCYNSFDKIISSINVK